MSTPVGRTGPDSAATSAVPNSQSFLASSIGRLSPWTRSPNVAPSKGKEGDPHELVLQQQRQGADHKVSRRHGISRRNYPPDCPPARAQWFHAVDVPKRRPNLAGEAEKEKKAPGLPKKYSPFSRKDSKAIEAAFQKLADQDNDDGGQGDISEQRGDLHSRKSGSRQGAVKVPVNEDYLFDVDVENRELGPAYWLGPVYDVRRGIWFYQDGSVQRPCDETLSFMLEEGYLKVKAWRLTAEMSQVKPTPTTPPKRSVSQPRSRPTSWAPDSQEKAEHRAMLAKSLAAKGSNPDLRQKQLLEEGDDPKPDGTRTPAIPNTHRLFGAHMNSVVTYQDAITAWILTDDFISRMSSNMYQRIYGGGHFAGTKVVRGYVDPDQKKAEAKEVRDSLPAGSQKHAEDVDPKAKPTETSTEGELRPASSSENQRHKLARQMSSLLEDPSHQDPAKQEEEIRRRDEMEIEDDYRETEGDKQDREIEHLVLVTHGIGQRLGLRIESVNFVHDVNTFRKTLKAVYHDSPDLRALNAELDSAGTANSRVQVLPICWRHLLDFPKQSLKHNRKEHDLADSDIEDDIDYPNLDDITVEGVPAVRNLITDLALDILLYQSPAYKDHISRIVLQECNRIYHLFCERNPDFKGKVSLVGHSLGSAIMFDLLCRQDQNNNVVRQSRTSRRRTNEMELKLDFDVEDFYALGSPIGLFEMLKGRTISARDTPETRARAFSTAKDDPFLDGPAALTSGKPAPATGLNTGEMPVSSPKCSQFFNIFHPTDPISYRVEPLVSPSMSSLKPQPLPYTKRGIFGAPVGQGFSGIGARVGHSVSSLWSSMSSGIASSLLTRGLGYAGDEPSKIPIAAAGKTTNAPLSMAAGTNIQVGVVAPPAGPGSIEGAELYDPERQDKLANDALTAAQSGLHPPTLIDGELETLYGGYEKRRRSIQHDSNRRDLDAGSAEWEEAEARGRRLRREEEKVRKLNSNGRIDYSIQEGAFDINILAAIASHLSYWADEDVSHFVISQLLSRHRVVRSRSGSDRRTGR